jgi:maltose alpha-D-glucosyltransferase/alpha-amylase
MAKRPGSALLAEANQWPADVRPDFGDGDEFHMAFHFPLMPRIYMALRQEDCFPPIERHPYRLTLASNSFLWLEL